MNASTATARRVDLDGLSVAYRRAGEGEPVVLIHGLGGTSRTWRIAVSELGGRLATIALDLPGFGASGHPHGDYSIGAFANVVRDMLDALAIPRATIVGHSLGGGIAMQFAYQYPERCDRLVLVSSGGLGVEVNPLLKALTLPGADLVLRLVLHRALLDAASRVGRTADAIGVPLDPAVSDYALAVSSLCDATTRRSFIETARSVIDHRGQRITVRPETLAAISVPTLMVWGGKDRIIPVEQAHEAHRRLPANRLEVFDGAGHFPHQFDPARFADLLVEFVAANPVADDGTSAWPDGRGAGGDRRSRPPTREL